MPAHLRGEHLFFAQHLHMYEEHAIIYELTPPFPVVKHIIQSLPY
jgi:hypothetical protein